MLSLNLNLINALLKNPRDASTVAINHESQLPRSADVDGLEVEWKLIVKVICILNSTLINSRDLHVRWHKTSQIKKNLHPKKQLKFKYSSNPISTCEPLRCFNE